MEVGEVPKGIRWSAEAVGPPKVRIGGVSGRGRGPTVNFQFGLKIYLISHFIKIYFCLRILIMFVFSVFFFFFFII